MFKVETDSCNDTNDVKGGSNGNGIVASKRSRFKKFILSRQLNLLLLQVLCLNNALRAIREKKDNTFGEMRATVIANTQIGVWQFMHQSTVKTLRDKVEIIVVDRKNITLKIRDLQVYRST